MLHFGMVPVPAAGLESGQIVPPATWEKGQMRLVSLMGKGDEMLRSREIAQQLKYAPGLVGC